MISRLPVAADDTHCCGSSVIRGSLVCALCLAHHPIQSAPSRQLRCVVLPQPLFLVAQQFCHVSQSKAAQGASLPSPFFPPRDSFRFLAQGCHPFLASWAVARFSGLLHSFGYGNRNLGRKALQGCAHVAMVTCKSTVPQFPLKPFSLHCPCSWMWGCSIGPYSAWLLCSPTSCISHFSPFLPTSDPRS